MNFETTNWRRFASRLHWVLIAAALFIFMYDAFILDDAYISFRYAENLAVHGELNWNPGEVPKVEGYTNFLWTLLIAGGMALGFDPITVSLSLGLLASFFTLLFTYRLAVKLLGSPGAGYLALIFLATNYTFSSFATGGLETQLQTCLVTAFLYFFFPESRTGSPPSAALLAALSLILALAVLVRMDSVLLIGPAWIAAMLGALKRRKPLAAVALIAPSLLILGGWLLWRMSYYGELLPNTYYVKGAGSLAANAPRGYLYLSRFFLSYALAPFLALAVFNGRGLRTPGPQLIAATILLWFAYLVKVGGDFMEFRFMVPVMPMMFIAIIRLILDLNPRGIRAALVAMVIVAAVNHRLTFTNTAGVESIPTLQAHVDNRAGMWPLIGTTLKDLFAGAETKPVIATSAAGAIPYLSGLPTVDMLGLSDKWIARNGAVISSRPGHQRAPTLEYLIRRKVNLVIGHPRLDKITPRKAVFTLQDVSELGIVSVAPELIPPSARFLAIPVDGDLKLIALLLVPDPAIGRVIQEKNITAYPILR